MQTVMDSIRAIEKKIYAYNYALSLINIDESTVAPSDGMAGRGEAVELLSMAQYELIAGKELAALLEQAAQLPLDAQAAAEVRELRRTCELYTKIPAEEYARDTRMFSMSMNAWHKAKANNDFASFAPWLEQCVEARQRWAHYFDPDKAPYSVWLDRYQPGLTVEQADAFFAELRKSIVPLLAEIQEKGHAPRTDFLAQHWSLEQQRKLSDYLMNVLHLSSEHCVLGETEHPFTSQLYDEDVRITTHYLEEDFTSSMYSVIHEGGHALYELHIDPRLRFTVLAEGSCTSVHESQSRLFENYIGRSEGFLRFIWPKLVELFPQQLADVTCEEFYRAVNHAQPSLIRTEADELTYPLHIMVRYELERKLLNGELAVRDLPAAWNAAYKEYLGIDVPDDTHGVLQDIHWSAGDFGYFPGYALGTAYAAQIVEHCKQTVDFDGCCARGDLQPIIDWLSAHIWCHGREWEPDALIRSGCGGEFDPHYFVDYLNHKYRAVYEL